MKLRDEKEVLDRQQRTDVEAQKNLDENLQQLKSRYEELNSQEEEMKGRLKRDQAASKNHEKEMKSLKKDIEQMRDKSRDTKYHILTSYLFFITYIAVLSSRFHSPNCWCLRPLQFAYSSVYIM